MADEDHVDPVPGDPPRIPKGFSRRGVVPVGPDDDAARDGGAQRGTQLGKCGQD
jgi:hypothetical protein